MSEVRTVIAFDIPMEYPGHAISKNHLFHGGNKRWGMNETAHRWKEALASSVSFYLLAHKWQPDAKTDRVHITLGGRFVDKNNSPDLHNLIPLCADAVEDGLGTGFNDRDFTVETEAAEYGALLPLVWVRIRIERN